MFVFFKQVMLAALCFTRVTRILISTTSSSSVKLSLLKFDNLRQARVAFQKWFSMLKILSEIRKKISTVLCPGFRCGCPPIARSVRSSLSVRRLAGPAPGTLVLQSPGLSCPACSATKPQRGSSDREYVVKRGISRPNATYSPNQSQNFK